MKSIKEQVDAVIKGTGSKQVKSISLIKLGLTRYEVNLLLGSMPKVSKTAKFNANTLTFGVEIECYNVVRDRIIREVEQRNIHIQSQGYNHADTKEFYKIVSDCSIQGNDANEIVSPILKGKQGENSLKAVCDSLNAIDAKVNRSTGLHVHFDASNISDSHFVNIFRNYAKIESLIDSFLPLSRRSNNTQVCRSFANKSFNNCETKEDVMHNLGSRYFKVNAESYLRHQTIEFRQHSGTTDYTKILNWINFLRKLIQFSFDSDIQECNSIGEIPFLTAKEKSYFMDRKNQLS